MKCADLAHDVSFHDSTLERVEREEGRIVLHLDRVAVRLRFSGSMPGDERLGLDQVRVFCDAARTRKLEFWMDSIAVVGHWAPEHPMVEIMGSEYGEGVLELSGFGPSSGWVVWQIEARRFQVQWEDRLGSLGLVPCQQRPNDSAEGRDRFPVDNGA